MRFEPNQPVGRREPTVVVDAGLPLGPHVFRLIVENERGRRSAPTEVVVTVVRLGPVLPDQPVVRPIGPIVPIGPIAPIDPTR